MPATESQKQITMEKLRDFIRRRNESEFQTNLQFQIDLDAAGIMAEMLPKAEKVDGGYKWDLGEIGTLIEERGKCRLERHGVKVLGIHFVHQPSPPITDAQ